MNRRNLSLALLLAVATPAAVHASAVCDDLRGRLADLPRSIGTDPQVRQYSSALAEQNLELRKVRSDLRRYGCSSGSVTVFGGENADYCEELEQSQARMLGNIAYLQERRIELRNRGSSDDRARRELTAALDSNGCSSDNFYEQSSADGYQPAPSIDEQAMRTDTFIPLGGEQGDPRYGLPREDMLSPVSTICVRTCDGGFFPISSNATSVDFGRDAATCAKMCPGIETELYYRDISSTDASTMISTATGTPYSAMRNAFAYKNRAPGEKSACACNLSAYYEEMRRNQAVSEPPQQGSITIITTKPPEKTAGNPAPRTQPQVPDRPYDPSVNNVRQVGPQFLAGDQGTIDLKNPAVPGPQPQQ